MEGRESRPGRVLGRRRKRAGTVGPERQVMMLRRGVVVKVAGNGGH
jgi:hypothetical protein